MGSVRTRRVAELIRQELAILLAGRVREPRLKDLSLSEVEVTPDLKRAYIYFHCPAGREADALAGFGRAGGFLRREIGARLELKFTPELVFRHDESLDKGLAMDRLLDSLKEGS